MGLAPLRPTAEVRARMRRTPQRDNPFEVAVRSALHGQGLRFRVHYRPVPSSRAQADVAFPRQRIAVLIDGCFWHSCPQHATLPRRNKGWWEAKLKANVERDRRTDEVFDAAGWRVIRFWEHEDVTSITSAIRAAVHAAPGRTRTPTGTRDQCDEA